MGPASRAVSGGQHSAAHNHQNAEIAAEGYYGVTLLWSAALLAEIDRWAICSRYFMA
jgi:hypothetical protein